MPRDARRGGSGLTGATVARVQGIPIRVHWTLAIGLPFFAWIMASAYFGLDAQGWAWGAGLAVLLFVSVVAHELAHSLVALRLGTHISEIILLPIGGASIMTDPPRDARREFLIAVVGPITSLLLGAAFLAVSFSSGVGLVNPRSIANFPAFVLTAGYLNVTLGVFNLLPAFPMDGGRVLRAALSKRLGLVRATRVAAGIGRGMALLMGATALLVGNLFLILIAVFVWAGAQTEERSVVMSASLDGVHLEDLMAREPATVAPTASVQEALDIMLASKHLALPVVEGGHPVGLLRAADVAAIPANDRWLRTAGDVALRPIATKRPEEDAASAMAEVLRTGLVAIVDGAGRLLGVVTPTDILRVVQLKTT